MFTKVINPTDLAFTDKVYHVTIGYYCSIDCAVAADCEQDALDAVLDHYYNQKEKYEGFFTEEENEDWISGGNYNQQTTFGYDELRIEPVDSSVYVETE